MPSHITSWQQRLHHVLRLRQGCPVTVSAPFPVHRLQPPSYFYYHQYHRPLSFPCSAALTALNPSQEGDEAGRLRRETAKQILRLLEGQDKDSHLQSALRILPVRVVAPRAWHSIEAAVAQTGREAFIHSLAPRWHSVPPFHTTADCECCIASSQRGRRFKAKELNHFAALLFECLPAAVQVAGLPQVQLNRFDLHHGHIFMSPSGQLGVLFHCQEYPAHHPEEFPVHLGNCQQGSSLAFSKRAMDLRNILWYGGSMCSLDVGEGTQLHQRLLMEGLQEVRTVQEADFGTPLADLYYFRELQNRKPRHRVFVCVPGT